MSLAEKILQVPLTFLWYEILSKFILINDLAVLKVALLNSSLGKLIFDVILFIYKIYFLILIFFYRTHKMN